MFLGSLELGIFTVGISIPFGIAFALIIRSSQKKEDDQIGLLRQQIQREFGFSLEYPEIGSSEERRKNWKYPDNGDVISRYLFQQGIYKLR